MLVTFDAILAPDELSAVRALLTQAPWASGLSAGPQALLAKRNQQLPEDFGPLPDLSASGEVFAGQVHPEPPMVETVRFLVEEVLRLVEPRIQRGQRDDDRAGVAQPTVSSA